MAIEPVWWEVVSPSLTVNSLWVTFLGTVAGATISGLLVIWIQNAVRGAKRLQGCSDLGRKVKHWSHRTRCVWLCSS